MSRYATITLESIKRAMQVVYDQQYEPLRPDPVHPKDEKNLRFRAAHELVWGTHWKWPTDLGPEADAEVERIKEELLQAELARWRSLPRADELDPEDS